MQVVLTGSTGFVGQHLLKTLGLSTVKVIGRRKPDVLPEEHFYEAGIDATTDYRQALINTEVVIHCAARVHVMDEYADNPLALYREVNTFGTLNLAKQAAKANVKRFIFISSIKVNGESTSVDRPFRASMNLQLSTLMECLSGKRKKL